MTAPATATVLTPTEAITLFLRRVDQYGNAGLPASCAFLGISRQAANPKVHRYLKRIQPLVKLMESGKPYDVATMQKELRPERNARGEYVEIPARRVGRDFKCDAAVIVQMRYPWWQA